MFDHPYHKKVFLCLNKVSCTSVCTYCLLSFWWAPVGSIWLSTHYLVPLFYSTLLVKKFFPNLFPSPILCPLILPIYFTIKINIWLWHLCNCISIVSNRPLSGRNKTSVLNLCSEVMCSGLLTCLVAPLVSLRFFLLELRLKWDVVSQAWPPKHQVKFNSNFP